MSRTIDELRTEQYHDDTDDLIEQDEGLIPILKGKRGEKDGKRKRRD